MFNLSISLADDALVSNTLPGLADILTNTARLVRAGIVSGPIRDQNGNTVGSYAIASK